jgi:hypothetical protein
MTLLGVQSWAWFFAGVLIGCWAGAAIATGGILLLAGRKVHRLENLNHLLRAKLKARIRSQQGTAVRSASMIVMPVRNTARGSGPSTGRIARTS